MIGINPIDMDVMEWADKMVPFLLPYGGFSEKLDDPAHWKEWANAVILINNKWQGVAPHPDQFDDWREWAQRFLQTTD